MNERNIQSLICVLTLRGFRTDGKVETRRRLFVISVDFVGKGCMISPGPEIVRSDRCACSDCPLEADRGVLISRIHIVDVVAHSQGILVTPGQIYPYDIDLWNTCQQFKK